MGLGFHQGRWDPFRRFYTKKQHVGFVTSLPETLEVLVVTNCFHFVFEAIDALFEHMRLGNGLKSLRRIDLVFFEGAYMDFKDRKRTWWEEEAANSGRIFRQTDTLVTPVAYNSRVFPKRLRGEQLTPPNCPKKSPRYPTPICNKRPLSSLRKRLVSIILLDPARTTLHLRYSLALLFSSMPDEYSEQANRDSRLVICLHKRERQKGKD